jgi:cyclic lactone autoinducer peptide
MKKGISKVVAKVAIGLTKTNVNSICIANIYQPKLPKSSDKLRVN